MHRQLHPKETVCKVVIIDLLTSLAKSLRLVPEQDPLQSKPSIVGPAIRVSFAKRDLRDHVLSGDFINCDFRGADLRGAILRGNFIDTCFVNADLRDANLEGATLVNCER